MQIWFIFNPNTVMSMCLVLWLTTLIVPKWLACIIWTRTSVLACCVKLLIRDRMYKPFSHSQGWGEAFWWFDRQRQAYVRAFTCNEESVQISEYASRHPSLHRYRLNHCWLWYVRTSTSLPPSRSPLPPAQRGLYSTCKLPPRCHT